MTLAVCISWMLLNVWLSPPPLRFTSHLGRSALMCFEKLLSGLPRPWNRTARLLDLLEVIFSWLELDAMVEMSNMHKGSPFVHRNIVTYEFGVSSRYFDRDKCV